MAQRVGVITGSQRPDVTALRMVVHELREPLAVIGGYTSMLEAHDLDSVQQGLALAVVRQKIGEMEGLVGSLSEAARLDAGRLVARPEVIELADVVREAVELAQPHAEQVRATIGVALPAELRVRADPAHVRRVLANLLHNAVRYSPAPGQVAVLGRGGDPVELVVRDRGYGIALADRVRIFHPFERAEGGEMPLTSGLGLGLAISRQLAVLNGGALELESSTPGGGSTFVLRLPAAGG